MNIFKKENNEIKFVKEEKESKIPSKMSKKALKSALKSETGVNSGLLRNIRIEKDTVFFLLKKGEKLSPGQFQLAKNKLEWEAIKSFLEENKINKKIIEIIREEGITLSLSKRIIKIKE